MQWKLLKEILNQTCPLGVNFSVSFALKNKLHPRNKGCILSFEMCLFPTQKKKSLTPTRFCPANSALLMWSFRNTVLVGSQNSSLRFNVNAYFSFYFLIQLCFVWTYKQVMNSHWRVSLFGAYSHLCWRAQGLTAQAGRVFSNRLLLMIFSKQLTYNKIKASKV